MKKILIINGPNLNLLGQRESSIYGEKDIEKINTDISKAYQTSANIDFFQSNEEAQIVSYIHKAVDYDCLIINPGALTHHSLMTYDALLAIKTYKIEVHISNVFAREDVRHNMLTSKACDVVLCGLGNNVYNFAVNCFLTKGN